MSLLNSPIVWDETYFNQLLDEEFSVEFMYNTYTNYIFKLYIPSSSKTYLLKICETTTEETQMYTQIDKLNKEVETQIDIYNLTIEQPLCPKIYYYNRLSEQSIQRLKENTTGPASDYGKMQFNMILKFLRETQNGGSSRNSTTSNTGTIPYVNNENARSNTGTNPYVNNANSRSNNGTVILERSQELYNNNATPQYQLNNNEANEINEVDTNKAIYVICMEYLNNYNNISFLPPYIFENFYNELIIQAIQIIIELLMKTGYAHGDFHIDNILFTTNDDTNFYKGIHSQLVTIKKPSKKMVRFPNIRPILIDFGDSYKLSPEKMRIVQQMFATKKYMDIIDILCKDDITSQKYTRVIYDYLCKFKLNKKKVNKKIDQYFKMREHTIENFEFYPTKRSDYNRTVKPTNNSSKSSKSKSKKRVKSKNRNSRNSRKKRNYSNKLRRRTR